MKLNCGLSRETKERQREEWAEREAARLVEWHDHFAWWPIRMGDNDCRWLEAMERRVVYVDDGIGYTSANHMRVVWAVLGNRKLEYEYRPK